MHKILDTIAETGLFRESNPGPPAPEAGIIPLDQTADSDLGMARCSAHRRTRGAPRSRLPSDVETCFVRDSVAEWSKALRSGRSPKGRGFEPHRCQIFTTGRLAAKSKMRAHPELNQGPADLQSAALTTELYTRGRRRWLESNFPAAGHASARKGPAEI